MNPKKKIVHIIQSLDNGGCENMLLRTLPSITEFDHVIYTLKSAGSLAKVFQERGISVREIQMRSLIDPEALLRLKKMLHEESPHLCVTYLLHADIIGRMFLQWHSSFQIIPFLRTTYNHPRYLPARIFEYLTKPFVSEYLSNGEAIKNYYIDTLGVSKDKIKVIPNGIDTSVYDKNINDLELKQELHLESAENIIICVANLHKNKGHQYLLEAFDSVADTFPKAHLLIVGEGPMRAILESQKNNSLHKKNIHFLGQRTDVPKLLRISDIFVLPTLFEGLSNAIIEAMAAKLPIITTAIPENKQLITDKKNGILIPPKDSSSLKDALRLLLTHKEERIAMGIEARKTIDESFSASQTTLLLKQYFFDKTL